MTRSRLARSFFLAFSLACTAFSVQAFPSAQPPSPVVEFYDQATQRYFVTINPAEIADLDAKKVGPGWVRTGVTFDAFSYPSYGSVCPYNCYPVYRFFAPGPGTHFFTMDEGEAESLRRPGSGWNYEGIAFQATRPAAFVSCGKQVHRMYRNPDHRFAVDAAQRVELVAAGWTDEGVAMCTDAATTGPLRSFSFDTSLVGNIRPTTCEDQAQNIGPCLAVENLASPSNLRFTYGTRQSYTAKTGLDSTYVFIPSSLPDDLAAQDLFVQQLDYFSGLSKAYGIHVDTLHRGSGLYSNITPLYQFRTSVDASGADPRVFPFRKGEFYKEAQLSLAFTANVKTLTLRNSASAAYGHPMIEFVDQGSGKHLYFSALTFSSFAPGDFTSRDAETGNVIVGTTFRNGSPYLHNLATWSFQTPSGFVPPLTTGLGGPFELRMSRAEFMNVLAAARTLEPALSTDPGDYYLDNYRFKNEIYGDGEIGMNITNLRLDIVAAGS